MHSDASRLGYSRHGFGSEHVMVLHDWNGDSTNYDAVRPYLDGETFTYVFADLRGYGRSRAIAGAYTVDEISRDGLALADALGWRRFHVIGHSMTGMATQRLAADAPARIKSAVAVCPLSAAGSPMPAEALRFFASTTTDDDAFRRLIGFVSGALPPRWAEAKLQQNRETVNPACRDGYLAMFSRSNFVADIVGLATPFLVVVGDRDPGIDAAAMAKTFLAWHPNAELSVVPNCGHYPMQECPPYFAGVVEGFLRRQTG
ncbi:MAG TPA: alpha/beta hydrolase [Rhizomicrobium sp.]|jgi:3-oxoadipate enol-lactonase|nr:alpha/beta hydrolase [Rhizomicrobium sp.]